MYAMYISHEEIELKAYVDFMQSMRYTKNVFLNNIKRVFSKKIAHWATRLLQLKPVGFISPLLTSSFHLKLETSKQTRMFCIKKQWGIFVTVKASRSNLLKHSQPNITKLLSASKRQLLNKSKHGKKLQTTKIP